MNKNSKFLEVQGQVIKRIFNDPRKSKNGTEYRVNYLVIKWITGPNGEYVDYVPIKCFQSKQIANIRAGYVVNANIKYNCSLYNTDEVSYKRNSHNGDNEPSLYPSFTLTKNAEIEVIDSTENWEQYHDTNSSFQQEVVDSTTPPPGEDDLPF